MPKLTLQPETDQEKDTTPAPEKEEAPKARKELKYGDEMTVRTTGDFELYDPNSNMNYRMDKNIETKMSRWVENMISQGKLKRV